MASPNIPNAAQLSQMISNNEQKAKKVFKDCYKREPRSHEDFALLFETLVFEHIMLPRDAIQTCKSLELQFNEGKANVQV